LRRELKVLYDKNRLDPFELYLQVSCLIEILFLSYYFVRFGLVLKEDKDHKAAVSVFVEALGIYPEFYDCWMELAALLADKLTVNSEVFCIFHPVIFFHLSPES
jgi:hypothetical protein